MTRTSRFMIFKKSALFLLVVFYLSLFMIDTSDVIKAWFWIVRLLMFNKHSHYFDEWSFLNFAAFHKCKMIVVEININEHCCRSKKWYYVCFFELLLICTHSDRHNVNWVVMIFLMSYSNESIWKNKNENLWLCLNNVVCVVKDLLNHRSNICNIIKNHKT